MRTYGNIRNIGTCQGYDYTTGCLLDYNYFSKDYKMITIDLSKQETPDADSNAIPKINFTGNLNRDVTMFSIIEESKETILDVSQGTLKVL